MTGIALLVAGGQGQLGHEIALTAPEGALVVRPGSADLDVTAPGSVVVAVREFLAEAAARDLRPVVVNASAFTAVDLAETNRGKAFAVNADGPRVLAAVCASGGLPLLHVSTDYVFAGDGDQPYEVDAPTGPKSVYGSTKLAGEEALLGSGARSWVVRTSWLYGARGHNFVKTMAKLERTRPTVSVVNDQVGSPTWARDLAAGLVELAGRVVDGTPPQERVLHFAGGGEATWFSFARAIFEELDADPERVSPCTTAEFPTAATRPAYSVLSTQAWRRAGLTPPLPWREALSRAFAECGDAFRGV